MRIGTRLVIALVVPLILVMALFGYLNQRRSSRLLQDELAREGRAITRTVQWAMEDAVRDGQLDNTRELVDHITGYERLIGLRIFDAAGNIYYQSERLSQHTFDQQGALATVLRDRQPVEGHRRIGDQPAVTFIFPLAKPGGGLFGAVEILQDVSFIEQTERSSRNAVAALTAVMILAMGFIIVLVTRFSVSRPVEALMHSFEEVGSGDLGTRVPVGREDEFGRLFQSFNQMGESLAQTQQSLLAEKEEKHAMETRLRNAERLAALGRLAAGLAHEIGTPLNVIGGRAESLLRKLSGSEIAERNLGIICTQIDRIARIVRGMLDFAREREPHLARTDVPAAVRNVLDLLEPQLRHSGVDTVVLLPEGLPWVMADADRLEQVFLNLTTNAMDAMPDGGTLHIRAEQVSMRHPERSEVERKFLAIAFEDTGSGIAPENLGRVFDPFFTTKEVGQGTGLGLSIAYGIAREHGGWINVQSREGQGTCLTVLLPLGDAPHQQASQGRHAS